MKHQQVHIYRDSRTGRIISQQQAERKNPATWERETVYKPSPKKER
jgi:hypothetical protein